MKNNSEISILLVKLRPGYAPGAVHYFYRRNAGCVSDSEQELIDNLRMRTMRHGMEFITGDAPAAQLRGAAISRLFNAGNLLSESYVYILPTVSDESFAASFEPMFDRILDFENWESENVDATNYFAGEWMMFSREQESHDDDLCYSESDIPPKCSRHRDKHITYSARPDSGPHHVSRKNWSELMKPTKRQLSNSSAATCKTNSVRCSGGLARLSANMCGSFMKCPTCINLPGRPTACLSSMANVSRP